MSAILFWAFGALLVASSLLVILRRSPITSALFLVLAFCSLAGIYLVLHAEFLGMVQIIVYAGAIMVLFLFVIMYLNLGRDVEGGVRSLTRRAIGWMVGASLTAVGALLVSRGWMLGPASDIAPEPEVGNTQALGAVLYTRYLFPFEVTSIVLLVAMVGAVVIARGRLAARPRIRPAPPADDAVPDPAAAPEEAAPAGPAEGARA